MEALRLESESDDMWTRYLSGALTTSAIALFAAGRLDEALATARKAVAIARKIEKQSPAAVTPHLLATDEVITRLTGGAHQPGRDANRR